MSKVDALELMANPGAGMPGNDQVTVSVQPVAGNGPTQLGMFDISVSPKNPSDRLINVQFIVQYAGQNPQAFTSFIIFDDLSAGQMYGARPVFCGNDAVAENRAGNALTVMVVGGVNASSDPFFVTQTFAQNLWPVS